MTDDEFEHAVRAYYADVYRFALSLTRQETDACDLVQQAFYLLSAKGRGLEDATKFKSWLFTTCYREFLRIARRRNRYPEVEITLAQETLPALSLEDLSQADAGAVMTALQSLDEVYRVPVALFYLRGLAYKEIAEMLSVPIGTVMSRLARGKERLRALLGAAENTARLSTNDAREARGEHD